MGLDMYLTRDYHLSATALPENGDPDPSGIVTRYNQEAAQAAQIAAILGATIHGNFSIMTVQVPVMYWRKANQIHNWFVENVGGGVDECQEMSLDRDQMKALLADCLAVQNDHSLAEDVLPPREGFFFGTYEYDEYYFADITETVVAIKAALDAAADVPWATWTYRASW